MERPFHRVSNANCSLKTKPAFFASDRKDDFSAFTLDNEFPAATEGPESSTNHNAGVSLVISPVSAEGAGVSGMSESPSSARTGPKLANANARIKSTEKTLKLFLNIILSPLQELVMLY